MPSVRSGGNENALAGWSSKGTVRPPALASTWSVVTPLSIGLAPTVSTTSPSACYSRRRAGSPKRALHSLSLKRMKRAVLRRHRRRGGRARQPDAEPDAGADDDHGGHRRPQPPATIDGGFSAGRAAGMTSMAGPAARSEPASARPAAVNPPSRRRRGLRQRRWHLRQQLHSTHESDCAAVCGNGIVETGEVCDDGNTDNGDGCDSTYQPPTRSASPPAAEQPGLRRRRGRNGGLDQPIAIATHQTCVYFGDHCSVRRYDPSSQTVTTIAGLSGNCLTGPMHRQRRHLHAGMFDKTRPVERAWQGCKYGDTRCRRACAPTSGLSMPLVGRTCPTPRSIDVR